MVVLKLRAYEKSKTVTKVWIGKAKIKVCYGNEHLYVILLNCG